MRKRFRYPKGGRLHGAAVTGGTWVEQSGPVAYIKPLRVIRTSEDPIRRGLVLLYRAGGWALLLLSLYARQML